MLMLLDNLSDFACEAYKVEKKLLFVNERILLASIKTYQNKLSNLQNMNTYDFLMILSSFYESSMC